MKKSFCRIAPAILILLPLLMISISCEAPQGAVPSDSTEKGTPINLSGTTSQTMISQTTSSAPSPMSDFSPASTPTPTSTPTPAPTPTPTPETIDFDAMRQKIYDEIPQISAFTLSVDYVLELYDHLKAKHSGHDVNPEMIPLIRRIDPFSSSLLKTEDIEGLYRTMPVGEVIQMLGTPNYSFHWPDYYLLLPMMMTESLGTWTGHFYWFMEDGTLLRVTAIGIWETVEKEPGTHLPLPLPEAKPIHFLNFYLGKIEFVSFEDVLNLKDYYATIGEYLYVRYRYDPREIGEWQWEDWPEVFKKYGYL